MTGSIRDCPHGGPAIQDQTARSRNDRAVGASLPLSFPAAQDRKHKSGRESFAGTTFCAGLSYEFWPWMEGGVALIGGFPTNVVNTPLRTPPEERSRLVKHEEGEGDVMQAGTADLQAPVVVGPVSPLASSFKRRKRSAAGGWARQWFSISCLLAPGGLVGVRRVPRGSASP